MHDFTLERHYAAAPEKVWARFTEPALMAQWFCPNPALDVACELDVRPGGAWRCAMGSYVVSGTYVEVDPTERLVFTWAWAHDDDPETTVSVTLTPDGDGTHLLLEHAETAPDAGDDGHRGGWVLNLDRLAAVL
ncbi:SRPBCC domain-containing protein [Nocardioides anomalus]|uniref:SRPBCC domain-containing protein n=1 Tax=Nocardioides anomalus TaxID=2712223 RepID=A0A6G6W9S8_9ACTN|nr:SRPBCC domain-containing protein [Nocardioides anomalus]QIG41903.1 SRPBCC domain-containing protein [Nocardioides anomalus]